MISFIVNSEFEFLDLRNLTCLHPVIRTLYKYYSLKIIVFSQLNTDQNKSRYIFGDFCVTLKSKQHDLSMVDKKMHQC